MLAPSSVHTSSPATTIGASARASSSASPLDPKNVSDGTCSGDTAGSGRGVLLGAPPIQNESAVTMPATTASGPTWRARRGRSSVPTVPTPITTAVTSSPAPAAPSRRSSMKWSSTRIATPTRVDIVTAAAIPIISDRPVRSLPRATVATAASTTGTMPTSSHRRAPAAPSVQRLQSEPLIRPVRIRATTSATTAIAADTRSEAETLGT